MFLRSNDDNRIKFKSKCLKKMSFNLNTHDELVIETNNQTSNTVVLLEMKVSRHFVDSIDSNYSFEIPITGNVCKM